MPQVTERQHFVSRFYLRNFAEPMYSDNLAVYDVRKGKWEERTPNGVGWSKHLFSEIQMDGTWTADFDKFLEQAVEVPATRPMKEFRERKVERR